MTDETCCDACGYPIHATKEMACDWCRQAADRIEALTEQRDAARQDAKEAEAYAKELERELRDTQDRANAFATKEYYTKMRAERAEAKLAKAAEVLEQCEIMLRLRGHNEVAAIARATLAEIKGGNDAKSDL